MYLSSPMDKGNQFELLLVLRKEKMIRVIIALSYF